MRLKYGHKEFISERLATGLDFAGKIAEVGHEGLIVKGELKKDGENIPHSNASIMKALPKNKKA